MTSWQKPPTGGDPKFGICGQDSQCGHGWTWPENGRKYGTFSPRLNLHYDAEWIDAHTTWDREIAFRYLREDGEIGEFGTGRTFNVFRDLPKRFPRTKRIHRLVSADAIDFENVGKHWSWAPPWKHAWERFEEPPFVRSIRAPGKPILLLIGRIRSEDVDWNESFIQNLIYVFSEREIVPRVGACVELEDVRIVTPAEDGLGTFKLGDSITSFPEEARVAH